MSKRTKRKSTKARQSDRWSENKIDASINHKIKALSEEKAADKFLKRKERLAELHAKRHGLCYVCGKVVYARSKQESLRFQRMKAGGHKVLCNPCFSKRYKLMKRIKELRSAS